MANASWDEWKQAIVDFAESHAWRTYMIAKRDSMSFPSSVPKDQARGGQWFVYELYNICDALVPNLSLGEFRSTVESKVPARLAHDLNLRESMKPFVDIEDYIAVFSQTTSMYRPSLGRPAEARRDSRRPPPANQTDRPTYVQRPLRLEGTFRDMRDRTSGSRDNGSNRPQGNRAPNVSDRPTRESVCFNCQKPGHYARDCSQAPTKSTKQAVAALVGCSPIDPPSKEEESESRADESIDTGVADDTSVAPVAALSWTPHAYDEDFYDSE